MRKFKIVKKVKTEEKTTKILCNLCGKDCIKDSTYGHPQAEGLIETEVHGGYYSDVLGDMTSYRFSLCEFCLRKLFNKFKVPVEICNGQTFGNYIPESKYAASEKRWNKWADKYEKKMKKQLEAKKDESLK